MTTTQTTPTKSLVQPIRNCFEEIKVQLSLQLPPMDTNNIANGTKSMLDRLVFKYKNELGGIIISYYDVVHVDKEATIFYDSPYLGLKIQVKFLVFKPFKNQILNGVVKRVSSTHISLLVFGIISASIPKSCIPKSFTFDHSSNMFVNKQNKASISVGTKIAFKVQDVSADRHNIGIQGDMTDLNSTGIIGFEESVQQQFSNNNNNKFNSNQSTPNKNTPNKTSPIKQDNSNNNNNITRFDDSDEDSDDEKQVDEKKQEETTKKDSKKDSIKKPVESDSSDSSSSSESESDSDDEKNKNKNKNKNKSNKKDVDSKKRKKDESSDESSSESDSDDEKDKKKKKSVSDKKSNKKSKVESSDESSSSEEEQEKKKKKKK